MISRRNHFIVFCARDHEPRSGAKAPAPAESWRKEEEEKKKRALGGGVVVGGG